jgi:peptide/nickel transport system permease protein
MSLYLLRRILQIIPMLFGIGTLTFLLIHFEPGDPIVDLSGEFSTAVYQREIEAYYGLDRPLWEQYGRYLLGVLGGDLGRSYYYKQPVTTVILERLPSTLLLVVPSLVLSSGLGIWLGTVSAHKRHSLRDFGLTTTALISYAIPIFWFAQLMLLLFAVRLDWFPVQGMWDVRAGYRGFWLWLDVAYHMALPVLTMTAQQLAMIVVLTRAGLHHELQQDYVRTARAKGLFEGTVLRHHALRNALLSVVTVIGGRIGFLFAGAVLTETVFAWPGLGRLVISASLNRDHPLILGLFLFISLAVLLSNLITDLIYAWLDPRIRYT